jgi:transposase
MFVRKKKNRSGTTSVVVADKSNGRFRELKTIGVSSDEEAVSELCRAGREWISEQKGELDMFAMHERQREERQAADSLLSSIDGILLNGPQLILSHVFRLVGFDAIDDGILRHLVIARLSQPSSKAGAVDYLKSYFDEDVELHKIYRYLDRLHGTQRDKAQQISVEHTRRMLSGRIGLMFYDVTTLYFETDHGDDLRERGFSKDGKHAQPQVVLGLLASRDGYPLSYSLFKGSQYEGHTMLPVVEGFVKRFGLEDFVVVADSGLMSKANVEQLEKEGYKYIIGARIKSETEETKRWILSREKRDGCFFETKKGGSRLVIGYSERRAKKDRHNRDKGVRRLKAAYKTGSLTKDNINKRGYNKFLEMTGSVKVAINQEKIAEDGKWDGLKGYLTNTELPANEVCEQYNGLWVIERAYRITKGTLGMRPMFHFTPRRIEAHVCICFIAYKVYKELERVLKCSGIDLSVDKVMNIAKTITTLKIKLPASGKTISKTMLITQKHKSIEKLFDQNFWEKFI